MNDLIIKNVPFCQAELLAVQDKETGKIYAGINCILRELGFDDRQIEYRRNKWNDDKTISKGVQKFLYPSKNRGYQETYCIDIKKLPIALAKIEITPKMENEIPELSDKLEKYQDECADILAKAFLKQKEERKESLDAVNRAADILKGAYQAAGTDERYLALLVGSVYKECGMEFNLPPVKMDTDKLYDQTMIANELGIMSASGKPHAQAVGAIIDMICVSDDDKITTPYTNHGHSSVVVQYKECVADMIREWIEDNGYPRIISGENKNYNVCYR